MPEASSVTAATVVAAAAAATGAVGGPTLASFGLDPYSIVAGLMGCAVALVFSPPEKVTAKRLAATALGSVLVASLGTPYVAPSLVVGKVPEIHANAVAAALLGACAKPVFLWAKARFEKWFGAAPTPPADTKGPGDV